MLRVVELTGIESRVVISGPEGEATGNCWLMSAARPSCKMKCYRDRRCVLHNATEARAKNGQDVQVAIGWALLCFVCFATI